MSPTKIISTLLNSLISPTSIQVVLPTTFILLYPYLSLVLALAIVLFRFISLTSPAGRNSEFPMVGAAARELGRGFFAGSGVLILSEIAGGGVRTLVAGWLSYTAVLRVKQEEEGGGWRIASGGCIRWIWVLSLLLMCPRSVLESLSAGLVGVWNRLVLRVVYSANTEVSESAIVRDEEEGSKSDKGLAMREINPPLKGSEKLDITLGVLGPRRSPRKR